MNIKTLKASILSNTIPNFLVFFIEEPALYRQYIHSISSTLGKDYEIYSTVKEAIYDIETGIKEDHIYVVFDDVEIVGACGILYSPPLSNNLLIILSIFLC